MAYTPYFTQNPYFAQPYYNNGAMPDMLNQQKMQYQQAAASQPITPNQNDLLWVLGEVEAQSYPVMPNNTVTLWDKNNPTIYIKSVNAQGVPSMRILDFTERTANTTKNAENHACKCGDKFVSKEDFNALSAKFDNISAIVDELKSKSAKKSTKGDAE